MSIRIVGFDADDTLWKSQDYFDAAQVEFESIMGAYIDLSLAEVQQHLLQVEHANISMYGYGAKGMTLSMLQAAVEMTDERITSRDMHRILDLGRNLLVHPVELLAGIESAVENLAHDFELVLITKGDLFHQEAKVKQATLTRQFKRIEIVSEKDPQTYGRLLSEFGIRAHEFLMVGNSMKSDVVPVVALGGWGVHVPYHTTWALENAERPVDAPDRVETAANSSDIPRAVRDLAARAASSATMRSA